MKIEITIAPDLDIDQIRLLVETIRKGHKFAELVILEAPTRLDYSFNLPIVTLTYDSFPERHFGDDAIETLKTLAHAA
jgi:hypothetical protein